MEQALEIVVEQASLPIDGGVGEDLSKTTCSELIQIQNQFNDRSRDFGKLFDLGRDLLTQRSKDMWAVWALCGGLIWSKRFPEVEGFLASCRVVTDLCRSHWSELYPAQMRLRGSLLASIVKWWSTILSEHGDDFSDETVREIAERLEGLVGVLVSSVEGEDEVQARKQLPVLAPLQQLAKAMQHRVQPVEASPPPAEIPEASDQPAEPTDSPSQTAPPPRAASNDGTGTLDQAYQTALKRLEREGMPQALGYFQEAVETHGSFADRFRGKVLLGRLYLKAGLATHAKRVLLSAHQQIDDIRLPTWDPKLCSLLWEALIEASRSTEAQEKPDAKLLTDLFAQLCMIDPATAAKLEPLREKG